MSESNSDDPQSYEHSCLAGTSDGSGNMIVGWQNDYMMFDTHLHFFDRAGDELGTAGDALLQLYPQERGLVAAGSAGDTGAWIDAFAPDGTLVRQNQEPDGHTATSAEDPLGGAVSFRHDAFAPQGTPASGILIAYDSQANERWRLPLTAPATMFTNLAVDRAGNTLLLFASTDGSHQGIWIDHGGAPITEFFPLPPVYALTQRVHDGLFLANGDRWVGSLDPGATEMKPAPGWLAQHPSSALHMVHGGRGYAVIPPANPNAARCEQTVEVFAPDGTACGKTTFRIDDQPCDLAPISIGYDGAVFERLPMSREKDCVGEGSHCGCTWQVWRGFFG